MMPLLHRFVEPDRSDNKFYGNDCQKHGRVLRYRANGQCVQCVKEYQKKGKRA